ncbi:hypothetical protein ACO22_07613 [Paracoccidioides brasiliensis]|uniref:Uncharacterized protein n=1 Tax=Paracoccidioides brasiliensis TaxID=121759 RepID=A0A1D2J447_PARBR|nr:hypothetical protein ACO22_07613 [Paracoccidioides brasiliensis]
MLAVLLSNGIIFMFAAARHGTYKGLLREFFCCRFILVIKKGDGQEVVRLLRHDWFRMEHSRLNPIAPGWILSALAGVDWGNPYQLDHGFAASASAPDGVSMEASAASFIRGTGLVFRLLPQAAWEVA